MFEYYGHSLNIFGYVDLIESFLGPYQILLRACLALHHWEAGRGQELDVRDILFFPEVKCQSVDLFECFLVKNDQSRFFSHSYEVL